MALVKCPECGHEVSDEAKVCPNCGYKLKKSKHHPIVYVITAIAGVVLVVCIGTAIHDLYMANKLSKQSGDVVEATSSVSSVAQESSEAASIISNVESSPAAAADTADNKVYYGKFDTKDNWALVEEDVPAGAPSFDDLGTAMENVCNSIGITNMYDLKVGNIKDMDINGARTFTMSLLFTDQLGKHILANVAYYGNITDSWSITSISNFDNGHVYYVTSGGESIVSTLYDYDTETAKQ